MTSLPTQGLHTRLVDFFIDRDGSTYGDEMERLRYYEAHSALLQMQAIASFLVGTIAALVSPARTVMTIYWVVMVPQMANLLALGYLNARRVRVTELASRSRRRAPFWLITGAALAFLAAVGARKASDLGGADAAATLAGALIGAGLIAAVVVIDRRRGAKRREDV